MVGNLTAKVNLKNAEGLYKLIDKARYHNDQLTKTLQQVKGYKLEA